VHTHLLLLLVNVHWDVSVLSYTQKVLGHPFCACSFWVGAQVAVLGAFLMRIQSSGASMEIYWPVLAGLAFTVIASFHPGSSFCTCLPFLRILTQETVMTLWALAENTKMFKTFFFNWVMMIPLGSPSYCWVNKMVLCLANDVSSFNRSVFWELTYLYLMDGNWAFSCIL
jgi:hypothetical protein